MADKGEGVKNTPKKRPQRAYQTRNKAQRALDKCDIAKLFRDGWSRTRIAEHLGVSVSMVTNDWKEVLEEMNADRNMDMKSKVTWLVAQVENIQIKALEAYEESREAFTKEIEEESTGGGPLAGTRTKNTRITEKRLPGSEYLQIALKCVHQKAELEGAYPSKSIDINAQVINWDVVAGAVDLEDVIEAEILSVGIQEVLDPARQIETHSLEVTNVNSGPGECTEQVP